MSNRLAYPLLIAVLVLTTAGCWSRTEIEKLAIVTIISYDKIELNGEDKWLVGARIIKPGALRGQGPLGGGSGAREGSSEPQPAIIITSTGDTIWEAARDMSTRLSRRDYIAHTNIIVLGERLCREGISPIIDVLLRAKYLRLNNWIIVTQGLAVDFLKSEPVLEEMLSQEITGLIQDNQSVASKAYVTDVLTFLNKLIIPGWDPAASHIELFDLPKREESSSKNQSKKVFRLKGASVFKDDRLVGWLSDRETMGFLYAINEAKHGMISLSIHPEDKSKKDVVFSMARSSSKIVPKITDGNIHYEIEIKAEGNLQEHEDTKSVADAERLRQIEQIAAEEIKKMVQEAVNTAKDKFKADIFGFGNRLHKTYPAVWKQIKGEWDAIYPGVGVDVKVSVKIRHTGLITNTPVITQ